MSGVKESDQFDKELDQNALSCIEKVKKKEKSAAQKRKDKEREKSLQGEKSEKSKKVTQIPSGSKTLTHANESANKESDKNENDIFVENRNAHSKDSEIQELKELARAQQEKIDALLGVCAESQSFNSQNDEIDDVGYQGPFYQDVLSDDEKSDEGSDLPIKRRKITVQARKNHEISLNSDDGEVVSDSSFEDEVFQQEKSSDKKGPPLSEKHLKFLTQNYSQEADPGVINDIKEKFLEPENTDLLSGKTLNPEINEITRKEVKNRIFT